MQRKVITLSRDTVLWEAGDAARGIAILEKGRLGARTDKGLMGVLLPPMVLGESALLGDTSAGDRRTVSIFAIDDDTLVTEYPVDEVKADFAAGNEDLMRHIVSNQVAQICRNLLVVISSKKGEPLIDAPLAGLVRGLVDDVPKLYPLRTWDRALQTARFLHDLRAMSDRLVEQLGPAAADRAEMIVNATQSLTQLAFGKDVRPLVEAFMEAEKQKTEWWTRGGAAT
jgi:CRP-like cAMP-binding protein